MEQTRIEARYHNFLLKTNRRFMYLYGFGLLLTYPLMMFFCRDLTNVYSLKMIGQVLNLLIAILGSIFIPLLMYRYTTSKKSIDVYDSLPLQKESMFRIHFFAGFTMLILPLLVSFSLGFIYTFLNPQPEILLNSSFYLEPSLSYEAIHFLEAGVALLLSYTITVFIKQNCGTTVDALIYTIVGNLTPILTYLAFYTYCNLTLLGFSQPFSTDLFLYLTPYPMMFNFFSNVYGLVSVPRFIFFLVLSIVLYIVSSHLYINHRSERAESPFMNRYFFPIISYVITIVAMVLLYSYLHYALFKTSDEISQFVYPMLIGCVFYLILDVIANRGFAHILKATINFIVIACIVVALLIPIDLTNGFGYVTRMPEEENIESITVKLPYTLTELMNCSNTITFTNKEEINVIYDFHKLVLDEYSKYKYSTTQLRYNRKNSNVLNTYPFEVTDSLVKITIDYNNKIGRFTRSYEVPLSWTYSLTQLAVSDSVNEERIANLSKKDENLSIHSITLYDIDRQTSKSLDDYSVDSETLFALLKEDMDSLTPQQFYESSTIDFGLLELNYSNSKHNGYLDSADIRIKNCYTKTIDYLQSLGISPLLPSIPADEYSSIRLIYPNEWNSSFYAYCNGYSCFYGDRNTKHMYKDLPVDMFEDLLPYLQTNAMYEEPGYLVFINSQNDYRQYIISPEYSSMLEELTSDIPTEGPIYSYEFK